MWKEIQKRFQDPEAVISLVLGVAIVIVGGVLLISVLKNRTNPAKSVNTLTSQAGTETTTGEQKTKETSLPVKYTVKAGDNLWNIALGFYKSGYNWKTIADENRLTNPDLLVIGQELTIPKADPILPEGNLNGQAVQTIPGNSYKVVKGDTLWEISCRAYSDCYRWNEIAKANNLTNPGLIEVDQDLKLPR